MFYKRSNTVERTFTSYSAPAFKIKRVLTNASHAHMQNSLTVATA